MTSIRTPYTRDQRRGCWRDVDRRRDVNRRRWCVIDWRWRCDIHRLRCERAAAIAPTPIPPVRRLRRNHYLHGLSRKANLMPMTAAVAVTLYMVRI